MPRRRGTRNAACMTPAQACLLVAPIFAPRSRPRAHSAAPLAAELCTPRLHRHRAIPFRLHHQRRRSLPPARPCPLCRRHQRRRRPPCHPRRTRAKRAKRARVGSLQHRDVPRPALQKIPTMARRRGTRNAACMTPAQACLLVAPIFALRSRPGAHSAAPLAAELRPPHPHLPRPHASPRGCRCRRHRCSRLTCRPRRPRRPAAT